MFFTDIREGTVNGRSGWKAANLNRQQQKGFAEFAQRCATFFGFALDFDQRGEKHDDAKVLKGFGGAGVLEVIEDDIGG